MFGGDRVVLHWTHYDLATLAVQRHARGRLGPIDLCPGFAKRSYVQSMDEIVVGADTGSV